VSTSAGSYGWKAGTLGFLVATVLVATMYTTFIFSFTELSTAIPHAGGPFAYARRAFGPTGGFIAGFATLVEFLFAPPAIALAIGAYLNVQFPALDPKLLALGQGLRDELEELPKVLELGQRLLHAPGHGSW
jgi:ethanolamine permease